MMKRKFATQNQETRQIFLVRVSGKSCPNPDCDDGVLEIQVCRGHCGYPVTHFWRHVANYGILFQVKISWNIDGHSLDGYQTLGVIPKEELGEILHAFMKWDFGLSGMWNC